MATNISGIFQTKVLSNLDTYNHTALQTSMYVVEVQMNEIPPSGLQIQIKQNGSTKATSVAPTAAQQALNLRIILNCAANDVIAVILSSSAASDSGPNAVKGILKITPGSV